MATKGNLSHKTRFTGLGVHPMYPVVNTEPHTGACPSVRFCSFSLSLSHLQTVLAHRQFHGLFSARCLSVEVLPSLRACFPILDRRGRTAGHRGRRQTGCVLGCLGFLGRRLVEPQLALFVLAAQRASAEKWVRSVGWAWLLQVKIALWQGPLDGLLVAWKGVVSEPKHFFKPN